MDEELTASNTRGSWGTGRPFSCKGNINCHKHSSIKNFKLCKNWETPICNLSDTPIKDMQKLWRWLKWFFLHRQCPCQEDAKSFQKRQGCSMINRNNLCYITSCSTKRTWKFPVDFALTDSLKRRINCLFITVTLYASKYEIKGTAGMGLNNLKLTKNMSAHEWSFVREFQFFSVPLSSKLFFWKLLKFSLL